MAERIDYTSAGVTRWTFRTYHTTLPAYIEWGAETIRERRRWYGWARSGESRAFSLTFFNVNGLRFSDGEVNAFSEVGTGYKKIWIVNFNVGPPWQPNDAALMENVVMHYRHRGRDNTLSHT